VISLRIELNDLAATQRLGTIIAHHLRAGDRLLLIGEVGSGKTTLARAIGSALHADPPLTSPTFLLVSEHQGSSQSGTRMRIASRREVIRLQPD
jgi:tRNA threonylcarbamoyladenosine biosynthesis protein TsaE